MSDSSQTEIIEETISIADVKMDTASESFPSSNGGSISSDCQDGDEPTLRLSSPSLSHCEDSHTKAHLRGIPNPHILISTLTITANHPLMTHSSPESPPSSGIFPDSIVHSHMYNNCKNTPSDRMLNLCTAEEECFHRNILNGEVCCAYGEEFSPHDGPQRNTSKNNLYFSDNVISPDSNKSLDADELRNDSISGTNTQSHLVDKQIINRHTYEYNTLLEVVACNKTNNRTNILEDSQSSSVAILQDDIPENTLQLGTKNEEDTASITALQEDSELISLPKDSWSNSGSSVDSLCGCSIKSQEENVGNHEYYEREKGKSGAFDKIPEYSLKDERTDSRKWLKIILPSGERRTVDMKVIEPYKRVLSHGGYALSGRRDAIVIFSACFLPDSCRVDYNYVMDNLFLYVVTTMEQLVTDEYILIYLHGSASKRSMPTFHWLKKCYQLIDRRLRKSLKHLYLVHPTFWLKSVVFMSRPFISSKFFSKLTYVHSLDELSNVVPVEYAAIPERVRRFDSLRS